MLSDTELDYGSIKGGKMEGRKEDDMMAGHGFDSRLGPLCVMFSGVCIGFFLS